MIHSLAPSSSAPCAEAPYDDEQRHVAYCGQITRGKGVFELLDAAAALRGAHPRVRYHLVGGSKYGTDTERDVDALIRSRGLTDIVRRHGWVENPREFLARADGHVAPSMWDEPFANVVLEAKAVGTPSVVFPSGGLPEMVRHRIDGFICAQRSSGGLAEGLDWLLGLDASARRRVRAAAAADSEARFGRRRFLDAWAGVYLDAVR